MKNIDQEKERFVRDFEDKFKQHVNSMELAEFRASDAIFRMLNLKPGNTPNSLWGMICFCQDKDYFYSFSQENFVSFYVRKTSGAEDPVDQCICLTDLNCKFNLPEKHFTDFMFPERKRTLKGFFLDEKKISHYFEFILNKKAADVISNFSVKESD